MSILLWIGSFLKATYFCLFYILGIFMELKMASKPGLYKTCENMMMACIDEVEGMSPDDIPNSYKWFVLARLSYFILVILGICTNQWLLFGLLISIGIINSNRKSNIKFTNYFSILIIIVIVINEYIINYNIHKIFIHLP